MRATPVPDRLQIIVVDPYATGCETLCACMAELGHHAVGARSAEIAEEIVRRTTFDLVIADHCLPWFDGWGLVVRFRTVRWTPAIILGTSADGLAILDTLMFPRPISLDDLERGIERLRPPRGPAFGTTPPSTVERPSRATGAVV